MDAIAIIGLGCRFPGARNPEEYWRLLCNGVDAITEVPADRWDIDAFYDPKPGTPGKMSTRWGGFLEQVDQFDPQFFGITPRETVYIDPQQRLLLEVAWEALDNAGQVLEKLAHSNTGVFVGISAGDYHQRFQEGGYSAINAYMGTGNALSIAANRLSYLFDFRGPSMAIDTACSSSLVAVHLACQSLQSGESNLALAGGVNLLLSPQLTIIFSQAQMMATDGRCKTFDARANGYVRGEGCGIVVLKRLDDAIRDNDNIIALIKGSALNQDGRSNGLTAPNGPSQEAVIRQALANAGVAPAQINYVEAHGTGTPLGDPIEAEALGAVLSQDRSPDNPCIIGSAKTNIGHLESAAGIAGLIKVALSLHHGKIPPSLHFQTANPYIAFEKLLLQVQQSLTPWPETDGLALAGLSSFGFGGTNAHIILGQAPQTDEELEKNTVVSPEISSSPYLLPLSARSPEALRALAQQYQEFLTPAASGSTASLSDICYTASVRRSNHDHRLSLVFQNGEELTEGLKAFCSGETYSGLSWGRKQRNRRPKLVFVFSGQGPQWWGMGRELLSTEPVFSSTIEKCDQLLRSYANWSLLEELTANEATSRLAETEIAQPAIFALQVALAALWRSWGIEPKAIIGHSVGEVAAAHVAGALSLEDAVQVVFHRARLMQQATGFGKMAAVELSVAEAEELLAKYSGRLSIAAINSPTSLVLSGEAAALEEVLESLEQRQIFCKMMRVNYAFHSPQMEPYQDQLVRSLQGITPQTASIRIISTVTGLAHEGENFDAAYWGRNIREPVRFGAAIDKLIKTKHNLFVEISPHPVLGINISQCLKNSDKNGTVLPSLRRQQPETAVMLGSLGTLYTQGYSVDWSRRYPSGGQCISLPSYPWQRSRYWLDVVPNSTEQESSGVTLTVSMPSELNGKSSPNDGVAPEAKPSLTRAKLLAAEPEERQGLLGSYLTELLARVMGIGVSQLDLQQPLHSIGLDSIVGVELRNQIETDLEVLVPLEYFIGLSIEDFITQVLLLVVKEANSSPNQGTEGKPSSTDSMDSTNESSGTITSSEKLVLQANLWVTRPKLNLRAKLRLFCFPYAGAGASIFRSWLEFLPPDIEVCSIQLPGRENRLQEEPFTRLSALIQALTPVLRSYLDIPFAFFGHSLGALISFELARELRKQNLPSPVHLFVSASAAPQVPDLNLPIHRLPDEEFIESLGRLNGTPEETLQNPELMELFLPVLRADFAILETYFYSSADPLDCPITVFGGKSDPKVSDSQLEAWRKQTEREFTMQMFPGDHFFLKSHDQLLLEAIATQLSQLVKVME
ncbi:beta-ketoacyl synthase N-terminal-like domain-containing protein [Moorena sp. SIO3H5]|uniref:beta-ketoacyl synthase N-terminal-like domain-containing protein n=1 Tax=Moorena sp. SIO3H5 TaxID=2607834 RepID=UPI0013BAEC18|nr:beta-ketoacyl synthase N-terminal-like domain-containing protein [Moorena sp. SIO3H5]NEO69417.1 acyltransferase domain-containing protein [Moorena sp. SIO3H5]